MLILAEDDDDEFIDEEVLNGQLQTNESEHGARRPDLQYNMLQAANFPAYRKDKTVVEADRQLLVIHGQSYPTNQK